MSAPTDNDYDLFPYQNYAFPRTTPESLYSIAIFFGLTPVDFRNCRVLELGCAAGANFLGQSEYYPNNKYVGIDLSERQINDGLKIVKELDLKNVTLEHKSILDIDADYGEFDYIIAHGVYSWVPPEVQDKLLKICKDNLSPNGLAYVSYNTLPGWNMVNSIRDMMRFHTREMSDPQTQVAQAKAIVKFIAENVNDNSPYGEFLKGEIEKVSVVDESYIYHEYLEQHNAPCYFYEFVDCARQKGLEYLSDCEVSTMFLGNFDASVTDVLKDLSDGIYIEQYLDFLTARRFRSSILFHEGLTVNKNLTTSSIDGFHMLTHLAHEETPTIENLSSDTESCQFVSDRGAVGITSKVGKLALAALIGGRGKPMSIDQLCEGVKEHFPDMPMDELKTKLLDELNPIRLLFSGMLELRCSEGAFTYDIPDKPATPEYARYNSANGVSVINGRNELITLDTLSSFLIRYLDGQNSREAIHEYMLGHVKSGEITLSETDSKAKVDSDDLINKSIAQLIDGLLENFASQALLIDPK